MTGKGYMSLAHGIEVTRDGKQGTLSIIQESYTNNRKICHMGECKSLRTPRGGAELWLEQPNENIQNKVVGKRRFHAIMEI